MSRVSLLLALCLCTPVLAQKPSREQKVRTDKERVESEGFWIYNDLDKGFQEAKLTGKPLLVVLRCIPCEECVKLDDNLVEQDPAVKPLLKEFVCVRQVSTNGLDLSIFQYDTDQSFAVFMLNGDGTIYGRFGTRSHHSEWEHDVSIAGLAKALQGALDLHENYPANKASLAAKTGPKPTFASPEKYPLLSEKYSDSLNYAGNVVQSCIHCHQIGDAERDLYRSQGKPIPETVLFPYPHPKSIGLIFDPKERAALLRVEPKSLAAEAGFRQGDEILSMNGQPLLSMADVQWVLHHTPPTGGQVAATVRRGDRTETLTLTLPVGWRSLDDISWRVSSWGLRRMSTGGLKLEELSAEGRQRLKIDEGRMALEVKHVGQYGPHAAAKNAGFRQGDVIVEFDGRKDLLRDADILVYGVTHRKSGDKVSVTVLRDGRPQTLTLPMQP